MRVLLISVADMAFGLPANSIRKVVRVAKSELIDVVDKKAIRLREQLIGLTWLHNVLGLPIPPDNDQELYILVTTEGGGQVGLIVDAVLTEDSVVIKPLPPHMQNLHLVSGVTTTGHDEIIPILNATKIVKAAQDMKYEGYGDRPHQPESRPLHVLVVDDSFSTREIEKNILEAYGYRVTLAADGIEALEQASGGHYDVIVTDVEMPRLDGFSLTARLRSDKKYEDVPIILVTSRDSEADKKKGMQIGANAYIVKGSFEQSNLLETIRNLVG
jgi:CheY-like chemotaxis protein/chemotaxis signal transduction protein